MLRSGVVMPPSCAAGIGSPSDGLGSRRPFTTILGPLPDPELAPPPAPAADGAAVEGGGSDRKRPLTSMPQVEPATPRAYVCSCVRTASTPTSRSQRPF